MKTWNPHYKFLDHWRGFAALWVMFFHGFASSYDKSLHPIVEPLKIIAKPGWLGVNIFFVISGYCIAASAYKIVLKNKTPWYFLKNRILRLFPVYWLAFIFTMAINLIAVPFNSTGFWNNIPNSWQSWVGNIFLIQPYLQVPTYVVVYWSLVVEVAFYLLVALLLLLASLYNNKIAIFAGLALAFASPLISLETIVFLRFWSEFVCGVLLFTALYFKKINKIKFKNISLFLIIALIIMSIILTINGKSNNQLWYSGIFSLGLYFLYNFDDKINSFIQLRWLKIAGTMSYSLYLLHVPFQGRIINLGTRFIPQDSLGYLFLQVLGWVVAFSVSYLFYRLVEKPLNDWRYKKIATTASKVLVSKN